MTMPDHIIREITANKGFSNIIASHHDPQSKLSWSNGSWIPFYNKALQNGDVIKLVGVARNIQDNFALAEFKAWAESSHPVPIIAINMDTHGKLSRITNNFMTPVTHPKLPSATAPGQLSAADIRRGLSLIGEIEPKMFYIFGYPVALSRSPPMHNTLFRETGLPHTYNIFETADIHDVKDIIRSPDFGGASVTMPLKQDIRPFMDSLDAEVDVIGAMNTIVPETVTDASGKEVVRLVGRNTDWQGMVLVLRNAGAQGSAGAQSGLVIGGGGTARAAIYALNAMQYSPIYIVGRSSKKLEALIESFPKGYDLRIIPDVQFLEQLKKIPTVAIGTIPADQPIESNMREILCNLFAKGSGSDSSNEDIGGILGGQRILLEMTYKPPVTALMQLATDAGWKTVNGLEVLVGQGIYQVCMRGLHDDFAMTRGTNLTTVPALDGHHPVV